MGTLMKKTESKKIKSVCDNVFKITILAVQCEQLHH